MVVGGNGEKSEAQMSETIERYDRAMAHKDAGDLEAAVAELEQILVDDPDHVLSHSALAVYLETVSYTHLTLPTSDLV